MKKKKKGLSNGWVNTLGILGILGGAAASFIMKVFLFVIVIVIAAVLNPDGGNGVLCNTYTWIYEDLGLNQCETDLQQYVSGVTPNLGEEGVYTIMVYMIGTDLETRRGAATSDIEEMLQAEISEGVRVLVYTGGAYFWRNNLISAKKDQVYLIDHTGIQLVKEYDRTNMAEPSVLSEFIQYARTAFPGRHESLILWDHGDGPIWGFGYVQNTGDSDNMMSVPEMDEALWDALEGDKLDFIAFDACLMGSLEVIEVISAYTDCMMASPEATSFVGFGYTDILNGISENPDQDVYDIGSIIVDAYMSGVANYNETLLPIEQLMYGDEASVICTYDCTKAVTVVEALEALTGRIQEDYTCEEIVSRAYLMKSYGFGSFDQMDLGMWACMYLIEYPEAMELISALDDMVTSMDISEDVGYSSGVSAFFPTTFAGTTFVDDGTFEDYLNIVWGGEQYTQLVSDAMDIVYEENYPDWGQAVIDTLEMQLERIIDGLDSAFLTKSRR